MFARLQKDDGSWPYRVYPETGEVKEEYTSSAIAPPRFLEDLDRALSSRKFAAVAAKAVDWTLNNPVRTFQWQGQYEDVSEQPPFRNLENWDVNETIRHLLFHAPDNCAGAIQQWRVLDMGMRQAVRPAAGSVGLAAMQCRGKQRADDPSEISSFSERGRPVQPLGPADMIGVELFLTGLTPSLGTS